MPDFPETVGGWLLDLLAFVGLGIGGATSAAASLLNQLEQDSFAKDTARKLTAAQAAEAVLKNVITQETGVAEAAASGYDADRFDSLVRITGNPPGPQELMALWRRGIINDAQLEHGLRQSFLRDEWIPIIKEERFGLPAVSELVAAVVQNHMTHDEAMLLAEAQGVRPEHFDTFVENAGNPPGPQQMLNLWVRGYVTEAEVDQALRESRLKNKWIPALKRLAIRKIPQRTVTMLISHGAMDDPTAIAHLRELGYEQADAEALVKAAHFEKAAAPRQLTVTQIRDLYQEHAITRDTAVADLVGLGYPRDVADQVMALADITIRDTVKRASIGRVRSAYDARRIDRTAASTALDALGVDTGQRDTLLAVWDIERDTNPRTLTEAQVVRLGHIEYFTPDEVGTRLVDMGYTVDDATALMVLGQVIENPNKPTTGA